MCSSTKHRCELLFAKHCNCKCFSRFSWRRGPNTPRDGVGGETAAVHTGFVRGGEESPQRPHPQRETLRKTTPCDQFLYAPSFENVLLVEKPDFVRSCLYKLVFLKCPSTRNRYLCSISAWVCFIASGVRNRSRTERVDAHWERQRRLQSKCGTTSRFV